MKSGFSLTDVLKLKLDSHKSGKKTLYYSIYDGISATGSTRVTNRVKQLNSGQITEYPYTLSSTPVISVSDTHAQYYQLDLQRMLLYGIHWQAMVVSPQSTLTIPDRMQLIIIMHIL